MFRIALVSLFTFGSIAHAQVSKGIVIDGRGPWEPYVKAAAAHFANARKISVSVKSDPTKAAHYCLMSRTCHMTVVGSGTPTLEFMEKLAFIDLGIKATGIIVTRDVAINDITTEQVRGIFSGKITNWKEIGGVDKEITVWHRNLQRGGGDFFDKHFDINGKRSATNNIAGVQEFKFKLKSAKNVITYNTVDGALDTNANFKYISLDGVAPTPENIANGNYKFRGPIRVAIRAEDTDDETLKGLVKSLMETRKDFFPKMGIVFTGAETGTPYSMR